MLPDRRTEYNSALPDTVATLLDATGVPPALLCLELTESAPMADAARALNVLTRPRALGVRLAVDAFGTGYSSLAYLKRLPVDEIKIDKSFVQHLATDETDRSIVTSTIGLGHSLGLRVVAEGVEDRETWGLLAALGADAVQGLLCEPSAAVGRVGALGAHLVLGGGVGRRPIFIFPRAPTARRVPAPPPSVAADRYQTVPEGSGSPAFRATVSGAIAC